MSALGARPENCCGVCPPIEGGGYDCTCKRNPRCPVYQNSEKAPMDVDELIDEIIELLDESPVSGGKLLAGIDSEDERTIVLELLDDAPESRGFLLKLEALKGSA